MPPLTTLAHMGEAREVRRGGKERCLSADIQPARLARLWPLRIGRQGGKALGEMTAQLLLCYAPHPQQWGERGGGASVRVERRGPSTTRVSSRLRPGLAADCTV
jgi:hypothetical protein